MNFSNHLLTLILEANVYSLPILMQLGWASAAFVLWLNLSRDREKARQFLLWVSLLSICFPILFYSSNYIFIRSIGRSLDFPQDLFISWGLRCAGGVFVALAWLRFAQPRMNQALDWLKVGTKLERNKKTDVREIHKFLPVAAEFDPIKYIDLKKGVFIGLNEGKKPCYINFTADKPAPHTQVVGTTGSGKSIVLSLMASQFLERGEAVFYFDPKSPGDEWAPHVLHAEAQRTGKPFHFIDLNSPHGPQLNPFFGARKEQIFELFQAGLSLTDRGDASDFYGIGDRREASRAAGLMDKGNLNVAQLYSAMAGTMEGGEKFEGRLRELAEISSINALNGQGVDLAKVIKEGGCVYIVGSLRNDIVKMIQKILLVRLYHLAEERDRIDGELRHICIVLDELKFHISRPAIDGMSAARDKGIHFIRAHQSLGDLEDCPADLNPKAVKDAIAENCKRRIVYQIQTPETARWMAEKTGDIQVDDEVRKVTRNVAQAEIVNPERSIRQAERNFIDVNMFLYLPDFVAVLFGQGLPQFVTVRNLQVKKSREAVQIHEVDGATYEAEDAIDIPDTDIAANQSAASAAIDI